MDFVNKYGRDRLINELLPAGFSRRLEDDYVPSNLGTDYAWQLLQNILINGWQGLHHMSDDRLNRIAEIWCKDQEFFDRQEELV